MRSGVLAAACAAGIGVMAQCANATNGTPSWLSGPDEQGCTYFELGDVNQYLMWQGDSSFSSSYTQVSTAQQAGTSVNFATTTTLPIGMSSSCSGIYVQGSVVQSGTMQ